MLIMNYGYIRHYQNNNEKIYIHTVKLYIKSIQVQIYNYLLKLKLLLFHLKNTIKNIVFCYINVFRILIIHLTIKYYTKKPNCFR